MPINYDGKDYEFQALVEHIKKTKPEIKSPGGYVKEIEMKQRGAKIKARIAIIVGRPKTHRERAGDLFKYYHNKPYPNNPDEEDAIYDYEQHGIRIRPKTTRLDPRVRKQFAKFEDRLMGKEIMNRLERIREIDNRPNKTPQDFAERALHTEVLDRYKELTGPQRPKKPTQADRLRIIKAKIQEQKIAIQHKHQFVFRYAKADKAPELVNDGKYWKYWLLNAKQVNGNGWGVHQASIEKNIQRFIDRPFVVTAKEIFPDSPYNSWEHPYLPTNDLSKIFAHQERFRVGNITKVFKDKNDDYYAMIQPLPKFASMTPPPFCSPAVFQLDPMEPENSISKWEALHLAGLDENPAYGALIASLKGTCIGTPEQCFVQFRGARQIEPTSRYNPNTPLRDKVPFGPTTPLEDAVDLDTRLEVERTRKLNPKAKLKLGTPTQRDRVRIIKAKLQRVAIINRKEELERLKNGDPMALHPKEFAYFEEFNNDIPPVRVNTFGKLPERKQGEISEPINIERGSHGTIYGPTSPLGKKIEDLAVERKLMKERGTDETLSEMFLRKFGPGRFNPGIEQQIGTINLDNARKYAKITNAKLKVARVRLAVKPPPMPTPYKVNEAAKVNINPEHGREIASGYESLKHEPDNPEVQKAYGAFISETNKQFSDLRKGGLKLKRIGGSLPGYGSSKEMHEELGTKNTLRYFPTESGFGNKGTTKHPLLTPTEFKDDEGNPLNANDVFRIVHDVNGHHIGGKTSFGPVGEQQAFLQHRKMYSPDAQRAMFTETAGQNNWVNFGPHGESNRKNPKNTIFAEQKAGLFPEEFTKRGWHV